MQHYIRPDGAVLVTVRPNEAVCLDVAATLGLIDEVTARRVRKAAAKELAEMEKVRGAA